MITHGKKYKLAGHTVQVAIVAVKPGQEPIGYLRICGGGGLPFPHFDYRINDDDDSIEHRRTEGGVWHPTDLTVDDLQEIPDGDTA